MRHVISTQVTRLEQPVLRRHGGEEVVLLGQREPVVPHQARTSHTHTHTHTSSNHEEHPRAPIATTSSNHEEQKDAQATTKSGNSDYEQWPRAVKPQPATARNQRRWRTVVLFGGWRVGAPRQAHPRVKGANRHYRSARANSACVSVFQCATISVPTRASDEARNGGGEGGGARSASRRRSRRRPCRAVGFVVYFLVFVNRVGLERANNAKRERGRDSSNGLFLQRRSSVPTHRP